jgi:hypothetical protein
LNRKFLLFALAVIAASMLATPVMAETFGEGLTVQTFTKTPYVDPATFTNWVEVIGDRKLVCDGTIQIGHKSFRTGDYEGPLGTGTFTMETLHSKTQLTTAYDTQVGIGGGVYQYTLTIDNGPYGSGTLKGIAELEWDFDLTLDLTTYPPKLPLYEQWDTAKLVPVEGDLNLKWVSVEGYFVIKLVIQITPGGPVPVPFAGWWWSTTTVVS